MDFVCKDFHTALNSLSQVIGVSEDEIISVLKHNWDKQYEAYDRAFSQSNLFEEEIVDDFGEYILQIGFPQVKITSIRPAVHWFHGSRAINPKEYSKYGILPLSDMYPKIKQMVDGIASKLNFHPKECVSDNQKRSRWFAEMKLNDVINHGGPFAVLMYEAASTPEKFGNHSYIDEPEIISNYAYMTYDKGAELILKEFKRVSKPIIVEFIEPCNSDLTPLRILITTVIQYLYGTIHNKEEISCGSTCFSNKGKSIPPELIVKIHRI